MGQPAAGELVGGCVAFRLVGYGHGR
jgi:hypothetical protein